MPKTVKVRFANGVLTPLEPLDLVEAEYWVTVATAGEEPATVDWVSLRAAQEVWSASPNGEYWEEFARRLPESGNPAQRQTRLNPSPSRCKNPQIPPLTTPIPSAIILKVCSATKGSIKSA